MNGLKRESIVSYAILAVLTAIAIGVYLKQFHYEPSIFSALSEESFTELAGSSPEQGSGLESYAPEGMRPLTPPETFDAQNLSDKINGKAELYLPAGFQSLKTRRFALDGRPEAWMEVFVYDMGEADNAFAVYSGQKRSGAETLDFASSAYRTANALFFTHGPFYVEIVSAVQDETMDRKMLAFAENYVEQNPLEVAAEAEPLSESDLFPPENLDRDSITLLASNAFGFEGFDSIWIAEYSIGGQSATAFLSRRSSSQEAARMAEAYQRFLLEFGGVEKEMQTALEGAWLVELFGVYELAFARGGMLAGVHEAQSQQAAEKLAVQLAGELSGE